MQCLVFRYVMFNLQIKSLSARINQILETNAKSKKFAEFPHFVSKIILLFHRNACEKKERTLFLSTDKPFISHISR